MPEPDGASFREQTRLGTKRIKEKISKTLGIKVKHSGGEGKAKVTNIRMGKHSDQDRTKRSRLAPVNRVAITKAYTW